MRLGAHVEERGPFAEKPRPCGTRDIAGAKVLAVEGHRSQEPIRIPANECDPAIERHAPGEG
jgi:hypothetical protein